MSSPLRIIVTGLIAQHPELGGMTWHYLNYVLGLAGLGHDVHYIEDSGQWPYNLDGGPSGNEWIAHDCSRNVNYLNSVMSRFGLKDKWSYHFPITPKWYGLSDRERKEVITTADLLINVSGSLVQPELYRGVRKLIYLDTDPVFTQIKLAHGASRDWGLQALHSGLRLLPRRLQGVEASGWLPKRLAAAGKETAKTDAYLERVEFLSFRKRIEAHDLHFSFGGRVSPVMPKDDYHWLPTRQPIVLSEWCAAETPRDVFTTVMSWTSYKPVIYQGQAYGQKDIEFHRFVELPAKVRPQVLEVAMGKIEHSNWQTGNSMLCPALQDMVARNPQWSARDLLDYAGWHVVDAAGACPDLDGYRSYIQSSKAEWSVAKNGYVIGQSGWFSDRSACYLACGRPVIVQDTGFADALPTGRGILPFSDMDQAVEAIGEVVGNYKCHAGAALEIAREYFDSGRVLTNFLDQASTGLKVTKPGFAAAGPDA